MTVTSLLQGPGLMNLFCRTSVVCVNTSFVCARSTKTSFPTHTSTTVSCLLTFTIPTFVDDDEMQRYRATDITACSDNKATETLRFPQVANAFLYHWYTVGDGRHMNMRSNV